MPIIVKDYEWEENNRYVCITVPLKGVKTSKVDITSTDEYLKVGRVYLRTLNVSSQVEHIFRDAKKSVSRYINR